MQVDIGKPLRALRPDVPGDKFDGKLKDERGNDVSLRHVCMEALVGPGPRCPRCGTVQFAADTEDGKAKFDRWMLAQKLEKAEKHVELTNDEIKMIKDAVAKSQTVIVAGQVWELLDPALVKGKGGDDAGE